MRQQLLSSLQLYRMSQQVLQVRLPVSHGDLQGLQHIVAHFTIFVFDEVRIHKSPIFSNTCAWLELRPLVMMV